MLQARIETRGRAIWFLVCSIFAAGCAGPTLNPAKLRCEYRDNPLAIDAAAPRLSWILTSSINGQTQTGYQILVASDPDKLLQDSGDLWDSGKVVSSASIQIPYAGKPLQSGQQCFWKVRIWDKDGKPSDWTAVSQWTMGVLNPQDWQATWIGRGSWPVPRARSCELPPSATRAARWRERR